MSQVITVSKESSENIYLARESVVTLRDNSMNEAAKQKGVISETDIWEQIYVESYTERQYGKAVL